MEAEHKLVYYTIVSLIRNNSLHHQKVMDSYMNVFGFHLHKTDHSHPNHTNPHLQVQEDKLAYYMIVIVLNCLNNLPRRKNEVDCYNFVIVFPFQHHTGRNKLPNHSSFPNHHL